MSGAESREVRFLEWLSGRVLVRLAVLAKRRGDDHEATHCAAALAVGNTGAHHEPCMLVTHTGGRAVIELARRLAEAGGSR